MTTRRMAIKAAILTATAVVAGCSDDADNVVVDAADHRPSVTVIMPSSGAGDNGYVDSIVEGLMSFSNSHDVKMHFLHPGSTSEGEALMQYWYSQTSALEDSSLLVMASSEYVRSLKAAGPLQGKREALVFEYDGDDLPDGVSAMQVERYGAGYVCGAMVARHNTYVIAALRGDESLEKSINGFVDGFYAHSKDFPHSEGCEAECEVIALADDYTGYSLQDKAYKICDSIQSAVETVASTCGNVEDIYDRLLTTYFPLAGGSNMGVYSFVHALGNGYSQVIGVDNDYGAYSSSIPFSMLVNIDDAVYNTLHRWVSGEGLSKVEKYKYEDGYIAVVPSMYYSYEWFGRYWEAYGGSMASDYWQRQYDQYVREAIEKEGVL